MQHNLIGREVEHADGRLGKIVSVYQEGTDVLLVVQYEDGTKERERAAERRLSEVDPRRIRRRERLARRQREERERQERPGGRP